MSSREFIYLKLLLLCIKRRSKRHIIKLFTEGKTIPNHLYRLDGWPLKCSRTSQQPSGMTNVASAFERLLQSEVAVSVGLMNRPTVGPRRAKSSGSGRSGDDLVIRLSVEKE